MKTVSLFLQRVKIIHKKFVDMKSHCPIAFHLMKGGNLLLGIQPDSIAHFHKKSLPGYQPVPSTAPCQPSASRVMIQQR